MKPVNVENRKALLPRGLRACFFAGLLLAGTGAIAQEPTTATVASSELTPDRLAARYPSGSIQSSEIADRALIEVDQQRTTLDQKYAVEQHDCYEKFFATSCLDAAKERRRVALAQIRKVEIEANAFVRGDRVVQRDKKLAEKSGSDAANPHKPLVEVPTKPAAQSDADKAKENQERIAGHEAKLKQQQQDALNDASKHAASLDAYNKKVQDAQSRQRDVAKKKADKANQAAAKAASAAALKAPASATSAASSQSTAPAVSSAPAAASTPATKP